MKKSLDDCPKITILIWFYNQVMAETIRQALRDKYDTPIIQNLDRVQSIVADDPPALMIVEEEHLRRTASEIISPMIDNKDMLRSFKKYLLQKGIEIKHADEIVNREETFKYSKIDIEKLFNFHWRKFIIEKGRGIILKNVTSISKDIFPVLGVLASTKGVSEKGKKELGVDDVIVAPFTPVEISSIINNLFREYERKRAQAPKRVVKKRCPKCLAKIPKEEIICTQCDYVFEMDLDKDENEKAAMDQETQILDDPRHVFPGDLTEIVLPFREYLIRTSFTPHCRSESILPLLSQLDDPDIRIDKLSLAVRQDQAFSTLLIKVSNSTYYSRGEKITSIDKAILKLGIQNLKKMISLMVLSGLYTAQHPQIESMLKDASFKSLAVAELSLALAEKYSQRINYDLLFLCGLTINIGEVIILQALDHKKEIEDAVDNLEAIKAIVYPFHIDFGVDYLESIDFQEKVIEVVQYHDQPKSTEIESNYLKLVILADLLISGAGICLDHGYNYIPSDTVSLLAELNIDINNVLTPVLEGFILRLSSRYGPMFGEDKQFARRLGVMDQYLKSCMSQLPKARMQTIVDDAKDGKSVATTKPQDIDISSLMDMMEHDNKDKDYLLYEWSQPKILDKLLSKVLDIMEKGDQSTPQLAAVINKVPIVFYYICKFSAALIFESLEKGLNFEEILRKFGIEHLKMYFSVFDETERLYKVDAELGKMMKNYNKRTSLIAQSCFYLARSIKQRDPEEDALPYLAQAIGLMHNIGEYVILSQFATEPDLIKESPENAVELWEQQLSVDLLQTDFKKVFHQSSMFREDPLACQGCGLYPIILYAGISTYQIFTKQISDSKANDVQSMLKGTPITTEVLMQTIKLMQRDAGQK